MGSLQPWLAGRPSKEAQTASSVLIWWQEGALEPDTPDGSLGAEVESASGIFPAHLAQGLSVLPFNWWEDKINGTLKECGPFF